MNTPVIPSCQLAETIDIACARIAPTWPLDRFIAVNPFWGTIQWPVQDVAAKLRSLSGAQLLMPRAWYRQAQREGRLDDRHLRLALERAASSITIAELREVLDQEEASFAPRQRVVDVVDAGRELIHAPSWRVFVTQNVSQFCAAYFDEGQARLGPNRDGGLYVSWRRHVASDRSPTLLMGSTAPRIRADDLPTDARELIADGLAALSVAKDDQADYLWGLLLDQNGWASWCAYRRWIARLGGHDDDAISDLLAIRVAWEWLLFRSGGDRIAQGWQRAMASWADVDAAAAAARSHDWLLQTAMEEAWREPVLRGLSSGFLAAEGEAPTVQAVFCIDVRSEIFRRALEGAAPSVHTLGFAGFFGVPMEYQPVGSATARPQLPGLLAPRLHAGDVGPDRGAGRARERYFERHAAWSSFKYDPLSTFAFVEALGLTYLGSLVRDSLGWHPADDPDLVGLTREQYENRKPRLVGSVSGAALDCAARCDLAEAMLRGMSLTRDFATLVLLAGHGSATRNNPHAAGLDCGACCGQTGAANARVAAALLNDAQTRASLAERGIHIPAVTWFVPGLHNTTTDDVELFDLDEMPAARWPDVELLRAGLAQAGARARSERAGRLGLAGVSPESLHRCMRERGKDWSQVRPEWGLADNAGFIVAPRERSRHLHLQGRAFLHDYRHAQDPGFRILEQIMTAPMLVTHWINFQYYASTVDNVRYGSGNKVLHNVVGGRIGVFEGNGGDLRIGLPMQCLHDGSRWMHTPLRLSVFIEAPRSAIDAVLEEHAHVRALLRHGWISLFQLDDVSHSIYAHGERGWVESNSSRNTNNGEVLRSVTSSKVGIDNP